VQVNLQYIGGGFDRCRYSCQNAKPVAHHTHFSSVTGISGLSYQMQMLLNHARMPVSFLCSYLHLTNIVFITYNDMERRRGHKEDTESRSNGGNKQQGEWTNSRNEYNREEEGPAIFFVHIFVSSTNFIFIVYRRFYLCCNNETAPRQHTQA